MPCAKSHSNTLILNFNYLHFTNMTRNIYKFSLLLMPVQNFLKFNCMNNNNKHSSSSNALIKKQCHRSNSGKMLISAKRNAGKSVDHQSPGKVVTGWFEHIMN